MSELYGVFSLRGFLYQIKVFELLSFEHSWNDGDVMTYEGIDDVDLTNTFKVTYNNILYQVKSGRLTNNIIYSVISNWLLDIDNGTTYSFTLITENEEIVNPLNDTLFESYYTHISSDNILKKHPNSKHSKAFRLRETKEELKELYSKITTSFTFRTIKEEDIESLLLAEAKKKSITNKMRASAFIYYYVDNIDKLIKRAVLDKKIFSMDKASYYSYYNHAISSVESKKYRFGYKVYNDKALSDLEPIVDKEFYDQITKVSGNEEFLLENIRNELEYEIFKQSFDDEESMVGISRLEQSVKTKYNITLGDKRINDNYSLYYNVINAQYSSDVLEIELGSVMGCCNFLTSSNAESRYKIKWDVYGK